MAPAKGPQQVRAEERRAQKLAEIREQIASGRLTVRQMTSDERKLQPQRAPKAIKPKRDAARQRGRG